KVNVGLASQVSVAVAVAKLGAAGQSIVLGTGKAAITGGVMSRTLIVWLAVLLLQMGRASCRESAWISGLLPPLLSTKVNGWLAVLLLPQASVAVQVRSCTTVQLPLLLSTKVNVGLASQVSVAVAVAKLGAAGQSIVLGAGKAAITGGVMSRTLIVWLAVLLLPQASVAVQVRTCTTGQLPLLVSTDRK